MKTKKNKLLVGGVALFGLAAVVTTTMAAFIIGGDNSITGNPSISVGDGVVVTDNRITASLEAGTDTTLDLDGAVGGDGECTIDVTPITMSDTFDGTFTVVLKYTSDADALDTWSSVNFKVTPSSDVSAYFDVNGEAYSNGAYTINVDKTTLGFEGTGTEETYTASLSFEWLDSIGTPLSYLNTTYASDLSGALQYLSDLDTDVGDNFSVTVTAEFVA